MGSEERVMRTPVHDGGLGTGVEGGGIECGSRSRLYWDGPAYPGRC